MKLARYWLVGCRNWDRDRRSGWILPSWWMISNVWYLILFNSPHNIHTRLDALAISIAPYSVVSAIRTEQHKITWRKIVNLDSAYLVSHASSGSLGDDEHVSCGGFECSIVSFWEYEAIGLSVPAQYSDRERWERENKREREREIERERDRER